MSNFISSQFLGFFTNFLNPKGKKENPRSALYSTYKLLFSSLISGPIDVTFSGSTATTCFISKNIIYTANSGDSRAIIGRLSKEGDWKAVPLSNDHKPDIEEEAIRIIESGGRIQPYILEDGEMCGPERVWLLEEDIPGLAMSRSIGDLVAASVGVTWQPGKIIYFTLFF